MKFFFSSKDKRHHQSMAPSLCTKILSWKLLLQTTSNSQIPPYYSSKGHILQCGCHAQKNRAGGGSADQVLQVATTNIIWQWWHWCRQIYLKRCEHAGRSQRFCRGKVESGKRQKKKEVHCIRFNLSMVPPKLWPIVHTKLLIIVFAQDLLANS